MQLPIIHGCISSSSIVSKWDNLKKKLKYSDKLILFEF